MPDLIRVTIASYDPSAHTADLRPLAHPTALLQAVPALESCPGELLAPGAQALALLYEDGHAALLGPYGGRPVYPLSARAADSTLRQFTAQAYTAYPGLSLTLTLRVASHLWITALVNGYASVARTASYTVAATVGTSQFAPVAIVGCAAAGTWAPTVLALRTDTALAPGTHTVTLQVYVYTAGDTISLRYGSLAAVALPG